MDRAILHCDNAYKIPNLRVTGFVCKTNTPSNTAFRGFGGPQGMMMAEQWISDVAGVLGISPAKVGFMQYMILQLKCHLNDEFGLPSNLKLLMNFFTFCEVPIAWKL